MRRYKKRWQGLNEEDQGQESSLGELFKENGIKFTFPNLKNLSTSGITYPQFIACVAQRLLLKQYAAQAIDLDNFLCPMSRTSEIFKNNRGEFSSGLEELVLRKSTLKVINAQSSDNNITQEIQEKTAKEFVKWYEKNWFNVLKSENMLMSLGSIFKTATISETRPSSGDWGILESLFSDLDIRDFLVVTKTEDDIFDNDPNEISVKTFDEILSSIRDFIGMGEDNLPTTFNNLCGDEKLISPTVSSFMISTLIGIQEIEERKKKYTPPLEPYNMFYMFRNTAMSPLLKMNQLVFTTYNYFKILL